MSDDMKTCPNCSSTFKQAKPPKAPQTYCSYWCHLEAKKGGLW